MANPIISAGHYVVLSKLTDIGRPMNLLEIGFSATPQLVRNMAARGMVKVEVTLTDRGRQLLAEEKIARERRKVRLEMERRKAMREARGLG